MLPRIKLLNLVVAFTLVLLAAGAMLVVLGIFNFFLNWDIFSPSVEALLYGVFASCIALAAFGAVMATIIAIAEIVRDFRKFVHAHTREPAIPDAPKKAYALSMLAVVGIMAVIVLSCAIANHFVLTRRCAVFKRLAQEQVVNFGTRILSVVELFESPPQVDVPRELYDTLRTLDNLEFVNRCTLYVSDPRENHAMWGYTAWRPHYTNTDGFARFYVAKDFEKAMRKALDDNPSDLATLNNRTEFVWYAVLRDSRDRPRAILRLDGNQRYSFREYSLF